MGKGEKWQKSICKANATLVPSRGGTLTKTLRSLSISSGYNAAKSPESMSTGQILSVSSMVQQ